MRPPRTQWCQQIDVTQNCHLSCSNCTRILLHNNKENTNYMSLEIFEKTVLALRGFLYESPPDGEDKPPRRKVLGLIGGEPLLHPQFPEIVDIMLKHVPEVYFRGLWTSKDWPTGSHPKWGAYKPQVERLIGKNPGGDVRGPSTRHKTGFLNWNMHTKEAPSRHTPLLRASKDIVKDEKLRMELIEACQIPRKWAGAATHLGYSFCEVAANISRVFKLGVELPVEPGVWGHDLEWVTDERGIRQPTGRYAEQIKECCSRCSGCVPLPSRLDHEETDDVSESNYQELVQLGSKAIKRGQVVNHGEDDLSDQIKAMPRKANGEVDWQPLNYLRGQKVDLHKVCEDRAKEKATKAAEKKAE